jgi:hypothetical protein
MSMRPTEALSAGREILDPLMKEHGFVFEEEPSGPSSGGPFASRAHVNRERRLEIHFRWSLGLVTYHFGKTSIDHESYMRVQLGPEGGNKDPGFSDDPLNPFRGLAYDLRYFAAAFLNGDFKEFLRCALAAEDWKKIPGFARLP